MEVNKKQLADIFGASTGKRKTFVNTTLGETWEAKIGERPDAEVMAERKEHYSAPVPAVTCRDHHRV